MDASARKLQKSDNESNRKSDDPESQFSSTLKPGQLRLVNEQDEETSLYELPLEMLDIILQKSYLHWILKSSTNLRDEDVLRSLMSVDLCFNRRITRQRFKKAIWRYLTDFYDETKRNAAIIRSNRKYLLRKIQPKDELIDSLMSLNCLTEEQSSFIRKQCSKRNRNAELLRLARSFNDTKFSNFVQCLRQTNQRTVASFVEKGGVVVDVKVKSRGTTSAASMDPGLLHRIINDLLSRTNPRSRQTDQLIGQLRADELDIIDSKLHMETVVVSIWCRSQTALENIQRMYESNQLRDVFFGLVNIRPSTAEAFQRTVINIDCNQFNQTVAVRSISVNFSNRPDIGKYKGVLGVTKLRNEIYVLCRASQASSYPPVIFVFDDRNPFLFLKSIIPYEIESPGDIASCARENCLYVSDVSAARNCIFKIRREAGDDKCKYKIIKWLKVDYRPLTLSVSSFTGQLLVTSYYESSTILRVYESDAMVRSIRLPEDIEKPRHAVETSTGNFIILHGWMKKRDKLESGTDWKKIQMRWVVSEVTRDGQTVVRRFNPSNETQILRDPFYLSLHSDDKAFVADSEGYRVILSDSDLKWGPNYLSNER